MRTEEFDTPVSNFTFDMSTTPLLIALGAAIAVSVIIVAYGLGTLRKTMDVPHFPTHHHKQGDECNALCGISNAEYDGLTDLQRSRLRSYPIGHAPLADWERELILSDCPPQ